MKTRIGFVSNSSSSSFIVPKSDEHEARKFGLKLIPVSDIKKTLKQFDDWGIGFVTEHIGIHYDIGFLLDGDFITEPMDRDVAYEKGIHFKVFEGDL